MRGCASKDRTFGGVGTKCLAFLVLLCGFGVATLSAGAQISLPSAGDIATVAGNGNYGKSGHSGPATSAEFYSDYAVATDASGNLYIVDGGDAVVLKVTASTGNMSTVAGKGTEGYSGDGAAATNAELNWPNGMALDSSGNIYIADSGNCRIRKVTVSTGVITTVAGNGNYGYSGDGAAATSAALNSPQGVAVDSSGNLYIADSGNRVVRKVTASSGIISTVAGTGAAGYTGDGGAATSAELALPESVAVDGSGDIYIADANNNVVRYVKALTGVITTVAGNGTAGYLGDNGAATSAELNSPQGIALDGSGNLYIADTSNNVIREVTTSTGDITTVAGNGTSGYSGDGGAAISAELSGPQGVGLDSSANIYIADMGNLVVRVVGAASQKTTPTLTVSSSLNPSNSGQSITLTATISNGPTGRITFYDGSTSIGTGTISGTTAALTTSLLPVGSNSITASWPGNSSYNAVTSSPITQTVNSNGTSLSVSSSQNPSAYGQPVTFTATISSGPTGTITFYDGSTSIGTGTISGTEAVLTTSNLAVGTNNITASWPGNSSYGAVTSSAITQTVNKATPTLTVSTSQTPSPSGQSVTLTATISNGLTGTVTFYDGSSAIGTGTISGTTAALTTTSLTLGANSITASWPGNSSFNGVVSGSLTQIVTPPGGSGGAGIINTVAGNGNYGNSGQTGPATSAEFYSDYSVATDASGNLYIADNGGEVVLKVTASTGMMSVVAGNGTEGYSGDGGVATSAELDGPAGIAVDSSGNIYIADSGNVRIRKVTVSTGIITTVAGNGDWNFSGDGGAATSASLAGPLGVAVDSAGNIYIADSSNRRVRKVTASTGDITTVAGTGAAGYTGDGGAATSAKIALPQAVAVDGSGDIYIADANNSVIRYVKASTGIITTVAGNGTAGYKGDGGLATSAELNSPQGIALDGSGNLYIADTSNNVIREVTASTGDIATIAGNGTSGYSGDGGKATSAELSTPEGVALDLSANIYVADLNNLVVREVGGPNQKSTPTITWNIPAAITYGTALSGTQLDASASVGGTFAYSPSSGTVLTAGTQTLSVTFTPSNTSAYNSVTASVTLTVNQATPTITWSAPAAINYGTTLSSTQLNATASVTGTFAYSPASGTVLTVGIQALSVTFAPTDTEDYKSATATMNLTVNQAAPTFTWATPTSISYGTALSATQLNATASVPGTFVYTPAAGSIPAAGTDALSVIFTPTDTTDYQTIYDWVPLAVSGGNPPVINTVAGTSTVGYTGDGGPAVDADLDGPYGLAFDAVGNLYIADCYASVVRKVNAQTGIISTVAGGGPWGQLGDGGLATSAFVFCPMGIAFDSTGNLYIAEGWGYRIREVNASTGIITTIAGNGTQGYSGDGGPAIEAELYGPGGISVDATGNVYYSDLYANRIREISASTGIITTVAGNGTAGFTGDGGPAVEAELNQPMSVVSDAVGNLYIADRFNGRIRKVTASTGVITTIVGNVGAVSGLITWAGGVLANYPGDIANDYVGDGGPATAAGFDWAENVALDSDGNIYISDRTGNDSAQERVREVNAATGAVTTIAGNGGIGYSGDGGPATSAQIGNPEGVAIGPNGNVYFVSVCVTCPEQFAGVRVIGPSGTPTITWPTPAPITYGTPLSSTQLDATASVGGTFSYTPPAGSILPAGTQTLSVTFTPTDGLDYTPVTQTVSLVVNAATPTLTFTSIPTQTYGVAPFPVSASSASSGAITYSVTSGPATISGATVTITGVGTVVLGASQAATTDYAAATASSSFTVNAMAPSLSVASSLSPSTYGQSVTFTATISSGPSGSVTFNDGGTPIGTGSISGTTASYTTSALGGGSHSITASWAGNSDYGSATSSAITQTVTPVNPAISFIMGADLLFYGQATTVTVQVSCNSACGSVDFRLDGNEWETVPLNSSGGYTATTSSSLAVGAHTIQVNYLGNSNYNSANGQPQTLTIDPVSPGITWSAPSAINYGTPLSGTQLNATASIAGTFVYSPQLGTILPPGSETLSVTFTPQNTTDYSTETATVTLVVNMPTLQAVNPIYSYTINYLGNGDVSGYTDSVMGQWTNINYDSTNRIEAAQGLMPGDPTIYYCWNYDAFGNRLEQEGAPTPFTGGGPTPCSTTGTVTTILATVPSANGNNQITQTNAAGNTFTDQYDAAGNITFDGTNIYLYDAEGRICAVQPATSPNGGQGPMTGYLYDADGIRVAKGTITSMSCDPSSNGFVSATNVNETDYILGVDGEQVTELDEVNGTMTWAHTNVWAGGQLLGTYDTQGLHYYLNDWLGNRRLQADYLGMQEQTCTNLPFGDNLNCAGTSLYSGSLTNPSEHHYTGKERDTESGNDYFGARYYSSSMGRFLSPDWSEYPTGIPYGDLENPQSLNLYGYVLNNPLKSTDPTGHTHQECAPDTTSTDPTTGTVTVTAGACHDVPDWWNVWTNFNNWWHKTVVDPWNARIDAHTAPPQHPNDTDAMFQAMTDAMTIGTGLPNASRLNKLNHVFNDKHNLELLVRQFGSKEAAMEAIEKAAADQLGTNISGSPQEIKVGDYNVTVTGANTPAGPQVGNAWIPGPYAPATGPTLP
jgi:RHS repeat-associated protein